MADGDGDGTFYFTAAPSTTYTGVIAAPTDLLVPGPTGLEYRATLRITATRAQFATQPNAAARPKLYARGQTWTLVALTPSDAHYILTCVPGS
jgi:hypothetical protein